MAMTSDEVVAKTRRLIQNVDAGLTESNFDDEAMLDVMVDERDLAELETIIGMSTLAIDPTASPAITPEASITLELGTILALRAAVSILKDTLAGRVSRGEMGTSWRSGFEGESTISAARDYRMHIRNIEMDAETAKLRNLAPLTGTRAQ